MQISVAQRDIADESDFHNTNLVRRHGFRDEQTLLNIWHSDMNVQVPANQHNVQFEILFDLIEQLSTKVTTEFPTNFSLTVTDLR